MERGRDMVFEVEELVGFLHDWRPEALSSIEGASRLSLGTKLGEAEDLRTGLEETKCRVAVTALEALSPVISRALLETIRRLRTANVWENAGAVLGTVGTIAVLGFLLPEQPDKLLARVSAVVGVVGSLISLVVKAKRKTLLGSSESIAKPLAELQDIATASERLLPPLRFALDHKEALTHADIGKAITDANDLIRRARQLLLELS